MWGAQALLEVRRRFLVGSGRPSMLMLVRSAAALATISPVLLLKCCWHFPSVDFLEDVDDDVYYMFITPTSNGNVM